MTDSSEGAAPRNTTAFRSIQMPHMIMHFVTRVCAGSEPCGHCVGSACSHSLTPWYGSLSRTIPNSNANHTLAANGQSHMRWSHVSSVSPHIGHVELMEGTRRCRLWPKARAPWHPFQMNILIFGCSFSCQKRDQNVGFTICGGADVDPLSFCKSLW